MHELLKKMLSSFFTIATGTLIAATLFITFLIPDTVFGVEMLWEILAFPLCTAPLILIYYSKKELSKKALLLRQIIHYLLVNIILINFAYAFDWLESGNLLHLIVFLILVCIVYMSVCFFSFASDKKEASKLNDKIREYQENRR